MQFPASISDQPAFLKSLTSADWSSDNVLRQITLPKDLAASGDFCEEAAALQMVGHLARYAADRGVQETTLESVSTQPLSGVSNYWHFAPWYAALRALQYSKSPAIDPPRVPQKVFPSLGSVPGSDVQRALLDRSSGFVPMDGAKRAFALAIGSGIESKPPALHLGSDVAPESDIGDVLMRVFENIGVAELLQNLSSDVVVTRGWFMREISHMARELYLNAVEHGTKSEAGVFLPRVVRGVIVRLCPLELSRLANQDTFTAMMSPFLGRCRERVLRRRKLTGKGAEPTAPIPLLELSFVDNGPGFVRTWLSAESRRNTGRIISADLDNVTPSDEQHIVQSCFDKHRTTKSSTGVGIGLYDVHKLMRRLGGIIVVRTSQVHLIRDYSRVAAPNAPPPDFENWDPRNPRLPEISGVAVSLLIPLVPLPPSAES